MFNIISNKDYPKYMKFKFTSAPAQEIRDTIIEAADLETAKKAFNQYRVKNKLMINHYILKIEEADFLVKKPVNIIKNKNNFIPSIDREFLAPGRMEEW